MPRVSVLIPSYKRPDDLVNTLGRTLQQDYEDFEIVVVDDGTPDDAIARAVARFPAVRYIRLEQNVGLIGARNVGERACLGEYIVNLDDDSWLVENDAMGRIVEFMDARPEVAVASFTLIQRDGTSNYKAGAAPMQVRTYPGGANVARRSLIEETGGYIEEFFRQGEEVERSLRIMDKGYKVFSFPQITVYHNHSDINRNISRHISFEVSNLIRRELIRAPFLLYPIGLLRVFRFLMRSWLAMDVRFFFKEVFGSRVPLWAFIRRHRKPVRLGTYLDFHRLS